MIITTHITQPAEKESAVAHLNNALQLLRALISGDTDDIGDTLAAIDTRVSKAIEALTSPATEAANHGQDHG